MGKYETVIGLEIHVALLTKSKFLCTCSTEFGAPPNSHCCPICLGLPGSLPIVNEKAVEYGVRAGLALNCQINSYSKFDRKNYFYPDLPKAYQITQEAFPLCGPGYVDYYYNGELTRTKINRIHLEEEAGKLVHSGESIVHSEYSLVDYNRAGIPLIEIVTAPDISHPEQARVFLEQLRLILDYVGVSDCKMEEGSLRCDANISLRPVGSQTMGTKVEIKNLNSFRALERALEYEVRRQEAVLKQQGQIGQETRTWDERSGKTFSMRSKADAPDYRYFPEPDLPPLELKKAWIEDIKDSLPELPLERLHRLMEQYGLSHYEASFFVNYPDFNEMLEETAAIFPNVKMITNWLMGDYSRLAREQGHISPKMMAGLLEIVDQEIISNNQGKDVLEEMFATGKAALTIVDEQGLRMVSDEDALQRVIGEVLAENESLVERFISGETRLFGFFIGQVMRKTQGKANPEVVNELLKTALNSRRI
ncbi:MAG: Asp-tRNA(Asn)/Glu-tRNA(Gln) amidotransferase subunit GatB [Firmicutes bacterium]|jgi:aspartyl-tRNA(Asn)/glutamyl-tRNA(Gln) amidotransferase subunit B|nr:Asp-tRNA(Asn)/Glu-tRNA(Gln) amidotransferase subunit GatB [Bacillota bacterium]